MDDSPEMNMKNIEEMDTSESMSGQNHQTMLLKKSWCQKVWFAETWIRCIHSLLNSCWTYAAQLEFTSEASSKSGAAKRAAPSPPWPRKTPSSYPPAKLARYPSCFKIQNPTPGYLGSQNRTPVLLKPFFGGALLAVFDGLPCFCQSVRRKFPCAAAPWGMWMTGFWRGHTWYSWKQLALAISHGKRNKWNLIMFLQASNPSEPSHVLGMGPQMSPELLSSLRWVTRPSRTKQVADVASQDMAWASCSHFSRPRTQKITAYYVKQKVPCHINQHFRPGSCHINIFYSFLICLVANSPPLHLCNGASEGSSAAPH